METITVWYDDKALIFPFKPATSVGTFTKQVEEATGCRCELTNEGKVQIEFCVIFW